MTKTLIDETSFRGSLIRMLVRVRKLFGLLIESRIALIGLIICTLVAVMAILAPWLATHDPIEGDFLNLMTPASAEHWMGTDQLGRDIWSRLVWGARNAVIVALIVVPLQIVLGVVIGGIAGYYGGRVDNILMRVCEMFMMVPGFYLLLALRAAVPEIGRAHV